MSKQYRWCEASGPVAHPDGSGKMLDSYDELVSGDGWAALAELGFVEEAGSSTPKAAVKAVPAPEPAPEATPEPAKDPAAGATKTVGEMMSEAAAKSDEEPVSVAGQAKKAASKRKSKKKK